MTDLTSEDTILLRDIRALLRELVELAKKAPAAGAGAPRVASDSDLDGQYGDPEVKSNPRNWTGDSMKGRKYSQCPPAFLDQLVDMLEWSANKADEQDEKTSGGAPVSRFRRLDAARARGWAARLRARGVSDNAAPPEAAVQPFPDDDDIPFSLILAPLVAAAWGLLA